MANKDLAEWLTVGPTFGIDLRDVITYFTVITAIISCFLAFCLVLFIVEVCWSKIRKIASDFGHAEILAFDSELQATQQELARRKAGPCRNKIKQKTRILARRCETVVMLLMVWWCFDIRISLFYSFSEASQESLAEAHMEIEQLRPFRQSTTNEDMLQSLTPPLSLPSIRRESRNELAATQQQNSELKDVYFASCHFSHFPSLRAVFCLVWTCLVWFVLNLFVCLSLPLVFPAPEAAIHGGWHQAGRGKHQFFWTSADLFVQETSKTSQAADALHQNWIYENHRITSYVDRSCLSKKNNWSFALWHRTVSEFLLWKSVVADPKLPREGWVAKGPVLGKNSGNSVPCCLKNMTTFESYESYESCVMGKEWKHMNQEEFALSTNSICMWHTSSRMN